jgi:imidazolonepropionase-like amidohydrolase
MPMPIKTLRTLLAASAALLLPAMAPAEDIAIHAGRLIDGVARTPRSNVTVLIHDDRIVSVTPGFSQPAGARLIDLSHKTLLPGLIDGHVHMLVNLERHPGQLAKVTRSSYDDLMSGVGYARTTLLAGFTSARDLGGPTSAIVALKKAINSGEIDGPRLWVAGMMLGPTGGHSDLHTGFATEVTNKEWQDGIIDGPADATRKVRALHQAGADVIKIMPSGGVSSVGDDPQAQLMTDEEIKAVVDTAHVLHMRVAAHAHGDKAIAHAAALGVDSIEHGTFASAETYKIMKAHGTYMEPTVIAGAMIADYVRAHPGAMEKSIEAKSLAVGPIMSRNAVEAYRAGVKISFGTDAGVFEHGKNAIEFQLLAKAGIPVIDTILAATSVAASLLDASADIGSVQPGRYADIIATDGNPLDDVTELQRVRFVMKGGKVYKGG